MKYDDDNCITAKLIKPVYEYKKNQNKYKKIIYSVIFILWSMSIFNMYEKIKNGKIKNMDDLFKIR
jgi:hypothetical protein